MQGGIGNQLFGLSLAHSVARLTGEPAAIDLAAFRADRYGHAFELEQLALDLGDIRMVDRRWMGSRLATAVMRLAPIPGYISEGAPPADEAALAAMIGRGRYFNGYWQNEAYIAGRGEFVARTREAVFRRAGPTERREIVIHHRTYKEEIRNRARRTAGTGYVQAALARIESALGRPTQVVLVSDDPALALRSLGDIGRPVVVASGAGPWRDMALLMKARALILTNSSFSWWGGFCGESEMAIYPRPDGFFHYPIPAARFACV